MHARVIQFRGPAPDEAALARELGALAATDGFLTGARLAGVEGDHLGLELWRSASDLERLPAPRGEIERWEVLDFGGKLAGEWCVLHALDGDAVASVLETALDRARAQDGNLGAVAL